MGITETDLLERLDGALTYVERGNLDSALSILRYCANEAPDQCDVWLAIAAASNQVGGDVLGKVVATRQTYNLLFAKLPASCAKTVVDKNPRVQLGFAGLEAALVSRDGVDGVLAAHAAALASSGAFQQAHDALEGLRSDTAATIRCWIYHRAGRFTDVLFHTRPLLASDDRSSVDCGHLLIGIAHAHLGNFGAARDHLLTVLPDGATAAAEPAAEAAYWIALTWREEEDHATAAQYLQRALSLSPHERFQQALQDPRSRIRLTKSELIAQRTDPWDVRTEPTLAQSMAQEMALRRGGLLEEGLAQLDAMIGMDQVKEEIRVHSNYIRGLQRRVELGLPAAKSSNHLIFAGPPGTGKTTVAKIIAKIYAGLGIIETDKLVVASKSDLVAQYEGQTAPKAKAKLAESLDGVLFIDEAYALVTDRGPAGGKDAFGSEAVTEILAFMEEHRERIVVIIAGYRSEIDRLLETNEGWSSRFTTRFEFHSYDMEALAEMALAWCEREGYRLTDPAEAFFRARGPELFTDHHTGSKVIDKLGNGRFVRNLMETSSKYSLADAMSASLGADTNTEDVSVITADALKKAFDGLLERLLGGV